MSTTTVNDELVRALVVNTSMMNQVMRQGVAVDMSLLFSPPAVLGISEDAAYKLQGRVNAELELAGEGRPCGYKISMTASEDRVPVNAAGPSSGVLYTHQFLGASCELRLDQMNNALLEPELVFRTTEDIMELTTAQELASVLEVTGGLEIPMSRVPGWFPPGRPPTVDLAAFIADNSAAGFVAVAGDWKPADALDTAAAEVTLTEPGGMQFHGQGRRVMDGPLNSMHWLFTRLLAAHGSVPAGTLVSSGTFMSPRRPTPGVFEAAFTQGLGTVTVTFS